MRLMYLAACAVLSSCATTSAVDLRDQREPEMFTSADAPQVVAKCLADTVEVNGTPVVTTAGQQTSVTFMIEGNAMLIFDITPLEDGSKIEARKAFGIMPGMKQAQTCF